MISKINIGDKEIEVAANAATSYWFTQVFHEDFFVKSQHASDGNEGAAIDLFSKVGYIMAMRAKDADMKKLSIDKYVAWLEQFGPMDMAMAAGAIADFYTEQAEPTAKAKN